MVDNAKHEALPRQAAKEALTLTNPFDHVVLAAMKQEHPVVDVVWR
jgi:hypothetical protein